MAGTAEYPASSLASPNGSSSSSLFSPRFRTAAALAGWDEEAILACLVVEDTPVQEPSTRKKRFRKSKTPTTDSSSRKKRPRTTGSPSPIPAVALYLDEVENFKGESQSLPENAKDETKEQPSILEVKKDSSRTSSLPCMDKLREELSCAICLDICYEPTTTPCGHSFCLKCLKCASTKCGKRCPKCRQLISNGRSCTINTVLWNTIQLLFPQEVESRRKAATAVSASPGSDGSKRKRTSSPETSSGVNSTSSRSTIATNSTPNPTATSTATRPWTSSDSRRSNNSSAFILSSELVSAAQIVRASRRPSERGSRGHGPAPPTSRSLTGGGGGVRGTRRREAAVPSQSEDAALALRLQREEFMGVISEATNRPQQQPQFLGVQLARANLRALAARAVRISTRSMSP